MDTTQMPTMTRKAFRAVHPDYKMVRPNGQHLVLVNSDRGTVLAPVLIVG